MKNLHFRMYALVIMAALAFVLASCSGAGGGSATGGGYEQSSLASAVDGKSDAWVNLTFAAEEQFSLEVHPTVLMTYAANAGDSGANDGALKVTYSGESGAQMHLQLFPRITPKSLPTSGLQTVSLKVKPVAGCVAKAVAFVCDASGVQPGDWHDSGPVSLSADAWTTVSVTVNASAFTAGVWRLGVQFNGDTADPQAQFAAGGTIYIDDFTALDYKNNDFNSASQLINVGCYAGHDPSIDVTPAWEASPAAGDGYIVNNITFPSEINTETGWGAWAGSVFRRGSMARMFRLT